MYRQDIDALLVEYDNLIDKVATLNPIYSPYYEKEDLKQDLREILVRCNNQFDPNRGASFKTYFVTSCQHFVWDERKKHRAESSLDDEIMLHGVQRTTFKDVLQDQSMLQDSNYYDYMDILQNIKDGDIVIDYLFNGRTLVEMARERGVSHQAIQQRNQLALETLRKIVEGNIDKQVEKRYNK